MTTQNQKPTTREERAFRVEQMNANMRQEGFEPDESDKKIQSEYIEGTKTLQDLLQHAVDYANANRP